jgi:hypothetical protein
MTKFKTKIIMTNYWIKDQTRQEIITKTLIPNKGNFNVYANYYNLIDVKGIGFQLSSSDLEVKKLYRKNGFEYLVLEHNDQKELSFRKSILPSGFRHIRYQYRL